MNVKKLKKNSKNCQKDPIIRYVKILQEIPLHLKTVQ